MAQEGRQRLPNPHQRHLAVVHEGVKSAIEGGVEVPAPLLGEFAVAASSLGALWSGTPLDELHLRIDNILRAEKKRIVVLMDDISRLDKIRDSRRAPSVKLAADFKYTAYIVAFWSWLRPIGVWRLECFTPHRFGIAIQRDSLFLRPDSPPLPDTACPVRSVRPHKR
jgi:hypothetical protein